MTRPCLKLRALLMLLCVASAVRAAPNAPSAAPLRLALGVPAGGPYARALSRVVLRPAAASGQPAVRIVAPAAAWDLAQLDGAALAQGCAQKSLRALDWSALGGRGRFLPGASADCGAGAVLVATVLIWDQAKSAPVPNWGDFWNVTRFPGGRGLHRAAPGTLEIALLADGVAPGDLYRVLRSRAGADRAFRKLDQLRPYIVWWQQPSEPARLVAAGRALMSSAPSDHADARHRTLGQSWSGAILTPRFWAIAATTTRLPQAQALIAAATTPVAAAALGAAGFPAALAPPAPPLRLDAAVPFDAAFWQESGEPLQRRFAAWLAH